MRSLPNIERSAFRKGQYVGYAASAVWKIWNSNGRNTYWTAVAQGRADLPVLSGGTLATVSERLSKLDAHLVGT